MEPDETLAIDVTLGWGVKTNTILDGIAFPLKFERAKYKQNLVRFTKTFEMDRKYL